MAYKYRKPYRLKRKRSIFRNRFFRIIVLIFLLIGSVIHFVFFSGFFQVKEVKISGANKVSRAEIKSFFPAQNIFLTDTNEAKENILSTFPEIAEIKINRKLPETIKVEIKERSAVVVWCGDECFFVDKAGKAFEKTIAEETDLIKIFGQSDFLEEETIGRILQIESKFKKDLDTDIEKVTFISPQRLDVKTAEGWEVYFSMEKDLTWQLTQLHLVLERQISPEERRQLEYINLCFNKVYYK